MAKPFTAWSYSRYALWELCPLKFKGEVIDGNRGPELPAMARGQKIHKGVAAYVMQQSDSCPPEAQAHAFPWKLVQEARAFDDKVVEQQWGFTRTWQPTGWFGKDTWFRSMLDFAALYEDMSADVIDWKSGKQHATSEDQAELNALSLFKHFKPATEVTTRMVYFDSGNEEVYAFVKADEEKLTAKWEAKVAPMFADTTYMARPNDRCKWCHFSKSSGGNCRYG